MYGIFNYKIKIAYYFCNALLEKIGEDTKADNALSSAPYPIPLAPGLMNIELDLLKKLQRRI